jgi:hypothetical protein
VRRLCENRGFASFLAAAAAAVAVRVWFPFPEDDPLLALVRAERPVVAAAFRVLYTVLSFTSPYIASSSLLSLAYIFLVRARRPAGPGGLPPYPDPARRDELFLVVGELHHPTRPFSTSRQLGVRLANESEVLEQAGGPGSGRKP